MTAPDAFTAESFDLFGQEILCINHNGCIIGDPGIVFSDAQKTPKGNACSAPAAHTLSIKSIVRM